MAISNRQYPTGNTPCLLDIACCLLCARGATVLNGCGGAGATPLAREQQGIPLPKSALPRSPLPRSSLPRRLSARQELSAQELPYPGALCPGAPPPQELPSQPGALCQGAPFQGAPFPAGAEKHSNTAQHSTAAPWEGGPSTSH
jgi:hypothetical protein